MREQVRGEYGALGWMGRHFSFPPIVTWVTSELGRKVMEDGGRRMIRQLVALTSQERGTHGAVEYSL
jgi:hypothetical protein